MVDCQCHGNLGFSGFQFLIGIGVTHANILSSDCSTRPRESNFDAIGMLSYHACASHAAYSLLRMAYSNLELTICYMPFALCCVRSTRIHNFGDTLEPRYIFGAPNRRIVSCYTLFKGWLPLSQPPICHGFDTAFDTERILRDLN